MSQNKVQFQEGISLLEFMEKYGTEEQCRQTLFNIRWPNGFFCESCDHDSFCYIESRKVYQCTKCKHQTSLKRNTLFHSSNVPLTKWFLAIYLLSQNKNGIAALSLKRQIDVSYPTALQMKHKLMQAMAEKDSERKLSGLITLDDAYLGGRKEGKRGRGSENKQPFIAAVSLTKKGAPKYVKFTPLKSFAGPNILKWADCCLTPACVVATDGFASFKVIAKFNEHKHCPIPMKKDPETGEVPYFQWINTILGNVKCAITGTYRSGAKKYSERYLAEFQYRINRRFNLRSLFVSLVHTAFYTAPLSGKLLKRAVNRL